MADAITSILTIFFIFSIWSWLWKPNMFFDLVLATLVGFTSVHFFMTNILFVKTAAIDKLIGGDIVYIIPIIIGVLSFTRLIEKYQWLNRYTVGAMLGTSMGVGMRSLPAKIVRNVTQVMMPLNSLENIVMVIAFILPISYFIFTRKEGGVLKYPSLIGRNLFMMWVGVYYTSITVSRLTYLSQAVQKILEAIGYTL
jgi:hypothetical protein